MAFTQELGEWITEARHHEDGTGLPVLGTVVEIGDDVVAAHLAVACLGVFRARVNGEDVGDAALQPGYTDYRRRVEVVEHDVLAHLRPGANTVRLDLAGGMYRSVRTDDRWTKVEQDLGDVAAAAQLRLVHADGSRRTVTTDATWGAVPGATTVSNWVGGEDYDAALEPDDSPAGIRAWQSAVPARVPDGVVAVAQRSLPVRVVEHVPAVAVTEPAPGTYVVDFGVNVAGWPSLSLPAAAEVRLRPAELLLPDGSVDVRTQGWGPVYHRVRTAAEPATWRPLGMYNGLRYLEVTGLAQAPKPQDVSVLVLAADAPASGSLSTSNAQIDAIERITRRAIRSNMFSVMTDCPQREKLGYIEQVHLVFDVLVRTYAVRPILDHTVDLVVEAQRPDGSIGLYVPEWHEFPDPWRGDPNWGGAVVLLPWALHREFGDTEVLHRAFGAMDAYLEYLWSATVDGLLLEGLGDFNGASVKKFRYVPLVSTATLVKLLTVAAQVADVVDRPERAGLWRERAATGAARFHAEFARADGGFGEGSIAEEILVLDAGLVTEAEHDALLDRIERRIVADGYYLDVGEVAMAALVRHLGAGGRHETLFATTQVSDRPSYGYMLKHGATSLTETWDGPTFGFSQNHFMNGAIVSWLSEHVVGIRRDGDEPGFTRALIQPAPCGDLRHASGHYDSPAGTIRAAWRVTDGAITVSGELPPGLPGRVVMPSGAAHDLGAGKFAVAEPYPTGSVTR
ncbi:MULTISPECIES: family 78 glycoside hydrolase catalytic domain [unclassified Actinotalea]|uniref:family 78 glycoside hydrolase catalytic domain n=1 Tax=unclassified Actinotalea TaxID=2638618 RepID=UPI0015F3EF6A|nr:MULTISPECIES: family 78 glycoside hydrolase catalytic domain [unclassified Actinotalea]